MARLQIFIQCEGKRDIRVIDLPSHATVQQLVETAKAHGVVAPDRGAGANDIAVFMEGADTPLSVAATLEAVGLGDQSSVHLSHCTRVSVTVHFNGQDRSRAFGPGVAMHAVKTWAVGKKGFELTPVDAAEHVLQLIGTADRPDEDVHIGSLVGPTGCKVEFDLVAKVRVEG